MKKITTIKVIILILGIFLTLSFIINTNLNSNVGISNKNSEYSDEINFDNEHLKLSEVSEKIHIDNNWTDAWDAGICTGNGTYSEPYVIEDLEIDGGDLGSCILIENSDVYFRIENCTTYNSGGIWSDAGIRLDYVNNGQIIDNNCSFNSLGIYLSYSDNNTVSGNTARNNEHGIRLSYSNYNNISGNTANNNDEFGIIIQGSDNNISGNNASYNT